MTPAPPARTAPAHRARGQRTAPEHRAYSGPRHCRRLVLTTSRRLAGSAVAAGRGVLASATLGLREDEMTRIGGLYGPDATFLGVPAADLADPASWAGTDIMIIGAPFDGGTSHRPGARFGPQAIR